MWASWGSSAPAVPEVSARTSAAASSSPSLSTSSSAIVASPQWRLISTISQKASRQLAKYPAQYIYASAAAALTLTVTTTLLARHLVRRGEDRVRDERRMSAASVPPHGAATGSGCAAGKLGCVEGAKTAPARRGAEDGDDDIEFADLAESAFFSYVRRVEKQKEAPLLAALAYLEAAVAELAEVRRGHAYHNSFVADEGSEGGEGCHHNSSDAHGSSSIDSGGSGNDAGGSGAVAEAQAKVHRLAVVADELLTQWICSLDGVPVRQSEALKQRRKALVQEAAALTRRISPHLPDVRM